MTQVWYPFFFQNEERKEGWKLMSCRMKIFNYGLLKTQSSTCSRSLPDPVVKLKASIKVWKMPENIEDHAKTTYLKWHVFSGEVLLTVCTCACGGHRTTLISVSQEVSCVLLVSWERVFHCPGTCQIRLVGLWSPDVWLLSSASQCSGYTYVLNLGSWESNSGHIGKVSSLPS